MGCPAPFKQQRRNEWSPRDKLAALSRRRQPSLPGLPRGPCRLPMPSSANRLRWATASVDTYGYKVAASMTKVVEEALGGEYTVTVHPFPQTTSAMKAAMEDDAEIGYTADIGMTQFYAGRRRLQELRSTPKASWSTLGTPIRWNSSWRRRPRRPAIQVPEGLQRQAGVLTLPAGFMNWLNFQRMYKTLGYDFKHVQIDPQVQLRRPAGRHRRGSVAYTTVGQIAGAVLEGDRSADGRKRRQSMSRRGRQAQGRRARRSPRSIRRVHSARMSASKQILRACRSCSATTCARTCPRTSSTRC